MADKLKMTVEVDKEIITSLIMLGGGLKDGTPSEKVKQWLGSHDSLDLKKAYLDSFSDNELSLPNFMGMLAAFAISKELKNEKEE